MTHVVTTMSEAQIGAFLRASRHAVVGTNRVDGPPQLSPVWYLHDEGRIYIGVYVGSVKYHNLRRDPRIAICVDGGHPDARAVMIYGTAELIEEESPWWEEINWRITRRYFESDEETRHYFEETRNGKRALIVVTPEKIISHDYNRDPDAG